MQSDPTTPPKRIWVQWPQPSGTGLAFSCQSRPPELRTEYILASEVAALIAEAEARVWERAAAKFEPAPNARNGLWANRVRKMQATLRAEVAAIRAAKGETT